MRESLAPAFLAALLAVWPAAAHHSFAAVYDVDKPAHISGIVTKVEWLNPHARFYIDVKDEKGAVSNWECSSTVRTA